MLQCQRQASRIKVGVRSTPLLSHYKHIWPQRRRALAGRHDVCRNADRHLRGRGALAHSSAGMPDAPREAPALSHLLCRICDKQPGIRGKGPGRRRPQHGDNGRPAVAPLGGELQRRVGRRDRYGRSALQPRCCPVQAAHLQQAWSHTLHRFTRRGRRRAGERPPTPSGAWATQLAHQSRRARRRRCLRCHTAAPAAAGSWVRQAQRTPAAEASRPGSAAGIQAPAPAAL